MDCARAAVLCLFGRAATVATPARIGPVAQWSELAAHNRLVGGSSPPGPTTHSRPMGDFPVFRGKRPIGGAPAQSLDPGDGSSDVERPLWRFVSGGKIPFPRETETVMTETRFECGAYGERRPSIWC